MNGPGDGNQPGDGPPDPVFTGPSSTAPLIRPPVAYDSVSTDVLYSYLRDIDPGRGSSDSVTSWSTLGKRLAAIHDQVTSALASWGITGENSAWTGPAADYFRDVATRIDQFGQRLIAAVGKETDLDHATFYACSYCLNQWVKTLHDLVNNDKGYVHKGQPWTGNDVYGQSSFRIDNEQDYNEFKGLYFSRRYGYLLSLYQEQKLPDPPNLVMNSFAQYQASGTGEVDNYGLDAFVVEQVTDFLNRKQHDVLALAANYAAKYFVEYGNALPAPPSPDDLPSDDSDQQPDGGGGGGGGGGGFSSLLPDGSADLRALNDPALSGLSNLTPISGEPAPLDFDPPDGIIGGDGTSLAGFTPTGLPGWAGLGAPGLDAGLGLGAGGFGPGQAGLAAGGPGDPLAGSPGALAAQEAAAANAARGPMGMYPPMMGAPGARKEEGERQRASYLLEDDAFWQVEADAAPPTLGMAEP